MNNDRKKAQKVRGEMLEQEIDMEMVRLHEQQFPAEDFERIVEEMPANLYYASRIRGIRETTLHTLAFLCKRNPRESLPEPGLRQ